MISKNFSRKNLSSCVLFVKIFAFAIGALEGIRLINWQGIMTSLAEIQKN